MSYTSRDESSNHSSGSEAEETLRVIARLPAPEGLEDRVQMRLMTAPRGGRVLAWPAVFSPASGWMRSAAAAAIVLVVAGGGWGIYTRVQPGQPARGVSGPRMAGAGGFSEGGAIRRPQTLKGPAAPQATIQTPKSATPDEPEVKPGSALPKGAQPSAVKRPDTQPKPAASQ